MRQIQKNCTFSKADIDSCSNYLLLCNESLNGSMAQSLNVNGLTSNNRCTITCHSSGVGWAQLAVPVQGLSWSYVQMVAGAGVSLWLTYVSPVDTHCGLWTQLRLVAKTATYMASPHSLSTSSCLGDKAQRKPGEHCISFYEGDLAVTWFLY